jgi:hypothetical protein
MMRKPYSVLFGFLLVSLLLVFVPAPVAAMTGSGTAEDPYMVYDVDDLQAVGNGTYGVNAYYELANDIDASATSGWNGGAGFDPIDGFTGSFNGINHVIWGLHIDRTDNAVGLFGGMSTGTPVIRNLVISDAYIKTVYSSSSTHGCGGILIAAASGDACPQISNVVVSGDVLVYYTDTGLSPSGHQGAHAGGLIGFLSEGNGHIERCASYADVVAYGYIHAYAAGGGLIGSFGTWYGSSAYVRNCYARGDAIGVGEYQSHFGGFIGLHDTNDIPGDCLVQNSYSTGNASKGFMGTSDMPSDVTNCFWDKESSGALTSAAGTGKTTVEMKTESTFTDAGWDFDTIWGIEANRNDGYPSLLWWGWWPDGGNLTQALWFQPNAIIEGTTLPDRMGNEDGVITWGANPAGIGIESGMLLPEEEYEFEPVIPVTPDIIEPEPSILTSDVDLEKLENNPLRPLVQAIASVGGFTERLIWLGLAWFAVIAAMLVVHLGPDTHKDSEKPQHFVLTTLTGLGLSILFYVMGIFALWVIILMVMGLVASIVYERMPVL